MARKKKQAPVEAPTSTEALEEAKVEAPKSGKVLVALNRAQGVYFDMPDGRRVEIAGNAVHLKGRDMGVLPTGGAFGLTPVDTADWEWIQKTYAKTALFRSGRIFAAPDRGEALAEAREKAGTRNGLEPAAPSQTETVPAEG